MTSVELDTRHLFKLMSNIILIIVIMRFTSRRVEENPVNYWRFEKDRIDETNVG